jgi:tetratricopeptide (TPR) repeat protein
MLITLSSFIFTVNQISTTEVGNGLYNFPDSSNYIILRPLSKTAQSIKVVDWLQEGNKRFDVNDYSGAINAYTRLINLERLNNNSRIEARLRRSRAYVLAAVMGSKGFNQTYDQAMGSAISDCSRVIQEQSNNPYAYACRGYAYLYLGNKLESIADYSRAIELAPNNSVFYYERGYAYYLQDNNLKAIADYSQAIKLNPNFYDAYFFRSEIVASTNPQQAEEDLNIAIKLDPNNFKYYSSRGRLHYNLGKYQDAINDFTVTMKIRPDLVFYCKERGFALAALHRYQEALDDFNHVIKILPNKEGDNGAKYYGRGFVYAKLGQNAAAIKDLKIAISGFEALLSSPPQPEYIKALELLKKLQRK